MSEKSLRVANTFLELGWREESPITPMKLQKLVYFAHGWMLGLFDQPLIDEQVEAWPYGPVVPSIYHTFKSFRNGSISEAAPDAGVIPEEPQTLDRQMIDRIWEVYGKVTAYELSALTHIAGSPWALTRAKGDSKIDNSLIQACFRQLAEAEDDDTAQHATLATAD